MKNLIIKAVAGVMLAVGGVVAVTQIAVDAQACNDCNFSNLNRKCGNCDSSRLFAEHLYIGGNGKLHTKWECKDCSHTCVTCRGKDGEVLLTDDDLKKPEHQEKTD